MALKHPNVYRNQFIILFTIDHCQTLSWVRFAGAFTELRKAIISFVVPVCPSAWNNSASTGKISSNYDI
jgi:hypothetical protein